jgi:neurabin
MYFTYTPEEYGRLDPCLDPVSASAEFELEKRIEKMNVFEVVLEKGW